jgi:hypothetical protein
MIGESAKLENFQPLRDGIVRVWGLPTYYSVNRDFC